MPLIPQRDLDYLIEKGYRHRLDQVGSEIHLILEGWSFGHAYSPETADLLIIIPPAYPLAPLDMFWTFPDVRLKSGNWPQAAEVHQPMNGRNWQRWSRHSNWRSGVDNLRTYMASVITEIKKGI